MKPSLESSGSLNDAAKLGDLSTIRRLEALSEHLKTLSPHRAAKLALMQQIERALGEVCRTQDPKERDAALARSGALEAELAALLRSPPSAVETSIWEHVDLIERELGLLRGDGKHSIESRLSWIKYQREKLANLPTLGELLAMPQPTQAAHERLTKPTRPLPRQERPLDPIEPADDVGEAEADSES